jgi:hypothetical protein
MGWQGCALLPGSSSGFSYVATSVNVAVNVGKVSQYGISNKSFLNLGYYSMAFPFIYTLSTSYDLFTLKQEVSEIEFMLVFK